MNATEMASLIGRHGLMDWDKFKVEVIISDVREVYGHVQFLVTPAAGSGERWTRDYRVALGAE